MIRILSISAFVAIYALITPSFSQESRLLSPQETAAEIDRLFAESWQKQSVEPAPAASDEEYVRRLYLDLAGRIPAAAETREFLENASPQKRTELVESLLDGPAFVRHFTIIWRNALIPQAFNDLQTRGLVPGFEAWLWKHFSEETPYDRMVHELITTPIDLGDNSVATFSTLPAVPAHSLLFANCNQKTWPPEPLERSWEFAWIVLSVMIIRSINGSAINSGAWRLSIPAFNAPKALIRRTH
jgi:hypothetical protein